MDVQDRGVLLRALADRASLESMLEAVDVFDPVLSSDELADLAARVMARLDKKVTERIKYAELFR